MPHQFGSITMDEATPIFEASNAIDLAGMSFTFNGRTVPGEALARLLGMAEERNEDITHDQLNQLRR